MGWQIEKDVCYPGTVVITDAKGKPHKYTFTQADIDQMNANGNGKVRDGWNVPLVWEHQDELPSRRPMLQLSQQQKDAEFARGVFGCSQGFVLRDTPKGPRLRAVLAGDDPEDLKQFEKVGYVSPEIQWNWRDTDGKVWPGASITHIAATPRPVQRHQDAVRMSQTAAVSPRLDSFLQGLAGVSRVGGTMVPLKLRLSLTDYAEAPMPDPTDTTGAGAGTPWERAAAALATCGVMIGDGKNIKDAEHFADLVQVACMNKGPADEPEDDLPPEDDEDGSQVPEGDMDQPPAGAQPPQGPPVQMSQTAQDARGIALERRNLTLEVADLERTRRIDPATAVELRESAKVVPIRLSLNATSGEIEAEPNEVSIRVAAFKKNKPGAAWNPASPGKKPKRLSQRAEPAPESPYDGGRKGDEDAAVKGWEAAVGRGPDPE